MLQVVLRGKALPGGKLMARGEWSVVDLLLASPPPPTTWLGVRAVSHDVLLSLHQDVCCHGLWWTC